MNFIARPIFVRSPFAWLPTLAALACSAAVALAADATPAQNAPGPDQVLFDGKSLSGWKTTEFGGHGEVEVKDGQLVLPMGAMLTGVTYTNKTPRIDYEVSLEAKRVSGTDFFCALTVPVNDTNCTLVVGGWGGGVVGISSLDGFDASENETTKFMNFDRDRWYKIRLRITKEWIQAWIDGQRVVHVTIKDRKVGLRAGEIEMSVPFGVASWQTTAVIRDVRLRTVSGPAS